MVDNVGINTGTGASIATDDVGGVQYQIIKLDLGADGASQPVVGAIPVTIEGSIPVTIASAIEITNDAGNAIPVNGTVSVNNLPATQAVSATSLPLPAGAATSALQTTGNTALSAIDTKLGGTLAVSGPLTDTQLRATAVPVNAASLPLPTGAATQTTLAAIEGYFKAEDTAAVSGEKGLPALAVRAATDAVTTDADGDYTLLKVDEEGRLKVSAKPASYPDITGDITAVQATIGTPVAGGTVEGDVSRASNVMALCTGTFAGVNVTFEGSLEASGATNWFGIQAVRTNANTIETATGVLAAQPVYGWEMSVNALKRVRVRCTARTSGTQAWRFVQGTYATEPIPAAQVSATQPVGGTVTATVTAGTVNPVVPATPYFLNSAATTNGALIITGTSGLQAFYATNTGATPAFVKLYNKATAPTVGTDVPEMIIPVPAVVGSVPGVALLPIGYSGFRFALGLGIAITGGVADNDTTAVAAGQVKVKLSRTV